MERRRPVLITTVARETKDFFNKYNKSSGSVLDEYVKIIKKRGKI